MYTHQMLWVEHIAQPRMDLPGTYSPGFAPSTDDKYKSTYINEIEFEALRMQLMKLKHRSLLF